MKRLLLLCGICALVAAPLSMAGTHWELATIEKISSNKFGEIHIKLDKTAASVCTNKRTLLLPGDNSRLDGLLSQAMFAYTTGEKIHIYGSGQCEGEFEVVRLISR